MAEVNDVLMGAETGIAASSSSVVICVVRGLGSCCLRR